MTNNNNIMNSIESRGLWGPSDYRSILHPLLLLLLLLLLLKYHFKFLGRWIHVLLDEKALKRKIKHSFASDINLVHKDHINGFMKLWIYQHYILARYSWPFVISNLNHHFAEELKKSISLRLKSWARICKTADMEYCSASYLCS